MNIKKKIKVLVVDDSLAFREAVEKQVSLGVIPQVIYSMLGKRC